MIEFTDLTPGTDGLVVAVVQDSLSGTVSMVGFMDERALEATQSSGFVHFWSRSRQELWMKGHTSGNTLALESIAVDCDADALLIVATPAGPVCHTGTTSCFGDDVRTSLGTTTDELTAIIERRRGADPSESYTARLLEDPDFAARKVLEEAGELAFAAKDLVSGGERDRVVEEMADLLYHALALTAANGVDPAAVAAELRSRMG